MGKLKIILFFLNILYKEINSKYPDNRTIFDTSFKFNYLDFDLSNYENKLKNHMMKNYNKIGRYHAFPNTIRFNTMGELFISVPRHIFNESIGSTIPSSFNKIVKDKLVPWPNLFENDYYNGRIHSIIGFEIDLDNNIYLLNHYQNETRELLVYNIKGQLIKTYDLINVTKHRQHKSFLTNIVLDKKYNFAYISDTGKIFESDFNTNDNKYLTKSCIIVVNLKDENSMPVKILEKHNSTRPDIYYKNLINGDDNNNDEIGDFGLYGLTLSCDKRFLYYSPIKSNNLYFVRTFQLQDERTIRDKDIEIANKKSSSFELLSSARGILYYTSIEDNSILVNFYERHLSFENIRSIKNHNSTKLNNQFTISIAFNNTSGDLFYLISNFSLFANKKNKDINSRKIDIKKPNFYIYKIKTNDRSYLYPCNIYSYMPSYYWIFLLIFSLLFCRGIVIIVKKIAENTPTAKLIKEVDYEEINNLNY